MLMVYKPRSTQVKVHFPTRFSANLPEISEQNSRCCRHPRLDSARCNRSESLYEKAIDV